MKKKFPFTINKNKFLSEFLLISSCYFSVLNGIPRKMRFECNDIIMTLWLGIKRVFELINMRLTRSFLSFLIGLRDWRGESNSGIWSGGWDIVWRLFSFSFWSSFNAKAKYERIFVYLNKIYIFLQSHHPYCDLKASCQLSFFQNAAVHVQLGPFSTHSECDQNNDI